MGLNIYKFNPIEDTFDIVGDTELFHVKDPVDSYSNLPTSGNNENDMRFVKDTDEGYVWTIASAGGSLSDWKKVGNGGDMLKSIYDTDDDGIVDKAESVDDGAGNASTAVDVKDAVTKKHNHGNKVELDKITIGDHDVLSNNPHNVQATQITDFDTEIENNAEVIANITNRHLHLNQTLLDSYTQTEIDLSDAVTKKHAHGNKLELDKVTIGDHDVLLNNPHSVVATQITDFDTEVENNGEVSANIINRHAHLNKVLLDSYTQTELDLSDAVTKKHAHGNKAEIDKVTIGNHDVSLSNPHNITLAQIGASPTAHNHLEIDITDLEHNATKINGIPVDAPASGEDGEVLTYNESLNRYELSSSGLGDMLKSVYDIDDNGIVDKAEALNDGSSGGGNNVTAQEARDHIDDVITNPHNVTASQVGVNDKYWLQTYILNTPSLITRAFGQSVNGLNPGFDIRLNSLKVQFYSEHPSQSALRIRVYKWDGVATTDRLILSITQSGVSVGYHNIEDNTPDTNYYEVDVSAGDRIWIEVDDGTGSPASRVREITVSVNYQII